MTEKEARAIVGLLAASFPRDRVERATVDTYTLALAELDDFDLSKQAVRKLMRTAERFPTVREIRDAYTAAFRDERARRADERGLPEPEPVLTEEALDLIERYTGRRPERPAA